MKRKLWLLGALILLLAIAFPASADQGPMRFEAPGWITDLHPTNGDLTEWDVAGQGELRRADDELFGYYKFQEHLKVTQSNDKRELSKVVQGTMTVLDKDGNTLFIAQYRGPSIAKAKPFRSPYGLAFIRWVGMGKVTEVVSEDYRYMQNANFKWKGFALVTAVPPALPFQIDGWMRFNPCAEEAGSE